MKSIPPSGLRVETLADPEALARRAADLLVACLRRKPDSLFCLASGGTPMRAYELLAACALKRPGLVRRLRLLKLDEWHGLEMDDPATCEAYFRRLLVEPLGLGDRHCGFNSHPAEPEAECDRVRSWLAANGPIDVCVLGLGVNGHIGLNEPAATLQPFAHMARLAPASLKHGMLRQVRTPPRHGLTLGFFELLQSREILLLVSGAEKRKPLGRLLKGGITTAFPASFLWLHPRVTLLCDQPALPEMQNAECRMQNV
jgi:galactosamine-6-phosphate isomerase